MTAFPSVLCTLLALVPSPSPSPAATASPLPQIAHVYTSDRTDETLSNAARTTYVVTHEQIVRNGYRTIAEALGSVPGVKILAYGGIGSNVNYGIRGSAAAQTLVLIDGLPAPGSFSDSVELGNLPTTGVDRIEVVEGGGSTLYGTGAIGGIINVITQRRSDTSATARYGSFAQQQVQVETPYVQFSRTLARNDYGLPNGTVRVDSDYASTSAHAGAQRRFGVFDAVLRAGISADGGGTPGLYPFDSATSREQNLNANANVTLTRSAPHSQTTFQLGGTRQQITFSCNPDPKIDPNCFQPQPALNTESRLDFSARNVVDSASGQLLYGVDLSRGFVRADSGGTAIPPAPDVSTNAFAQTAAYVQQSFSGAWGRLYAGLRGERDGGLGGEFSPSLGFVARLSNEATIKGNVATAFRAPNATELYFPGYGNPALHPERAKVADLSIVDSHALGGVTLGWFMNRTNDLIVPVLVDPKTFAYAPENVDHAFIEGLTLDVRTRPFNRFTASFDLTDTYRAQDLDSGARLNEDPVLAANLRLDYAAPRTGALDGWGAAVHLAGARGYVDYTQPLFDQPAAFTTVDAYVRVRAGHDLLLTLRGYNLGNERYAALGGFGGVNGYPMPGRSFILEVSTR